METDLRTFFLQVKTTIEIRRNPILKIIPAREGLFLLREADILASVNNVFLHFSETLDSDSFFPV